METQEWQSRLSLHQLAANSFGSRAEYFVGTAEIGENKFNDNLRGVIESPPFLLRHESYVLFVSGGRDQDRVFVALIDAETGQELARVTGTGSNELKKTVLSCPGAAGKTAVVRIVDEATGSWGHINFGGIYDDPLAPYRN